MRRPNLMKQKMEEGGIPLGTFLHHSIDSTMIGVAGNAGADFVFIDMEHFPFDITDVVRAVAAADAAGMTPFIRIPEITRTTIGYLLDAGAKTIFAPNIRSAQEVRTLLDYALYPPDGTRGMFISNTPAVGYAVSTDVAEATRFQNDNMLIGVNIETVEAIENLEEILMPGVGFALVGHEDLSQAYGLPGQFEHPLILEAKASVRSLCKERGIRYIGVAFAPEAIAGEVAGGADLILYGGVIPWVRAGVAAGVAALKAATA